LRWRASPITQVTRRLAIMRIPAEILEGLAYARTIPSSCWWFGITVVTRRLCLRLPGPRGTAWPWRLPCLARSRGLLAAGEPLGALLGGTLIAGGFIRMNRTLTFAGGSSLFMVGLIVMALSPSYWFGLLALIIGGFGTRVSATCRTTLMLTEAPAEMRSRLMGVVTMGIGQPARSHPGGGRSVRSYRHPSGGGVCHFTTSLSVARPPQHRRSGRRLRATRATANREDGHRAADVIGQNARHQMRAGRCRYPS